MQIKNSAKIYNDKLPTILSHSNYYTNPQNEKITAKKMATIGGYSK